MPYYVDLDKKINVMLRTELYGDIGVCEMSIRQYLDNVVGAELPAEDVRPVVRGRWVKKFENPLDGTFYCSNCKGEIDIADGGDTPLKRGLYYCHNCGADLREADNGKET